MTTSKEREAFEKRFANLRLDRNMPDGSYNNPAAHERWIGWNARSQAAPEAVALRTVAAPFAWYSMEARTDDPRDGIEIEYFNGPTKPQGVDAAPLFTSPASEPALVALRDLLELHSSKGHDSQEWALAWAAARAALKGAAAPAKVGCEGADGLLRVHAETDTCDVCAPSTVPLAAAPTAQPVPQDALGVPASPSGHTLQPPSSASAAVPNANCRCHACIERYDLRSPCGLSLSSTQMIVCPSCGDKRCVHAMNHEAPCAKDDGTTGSAQPVPAAPGQQPDTEKP